MSDERKKKPSWWRIALTLGIILIIGYLIYVGKHC